MGRLLQGCGTSDLSLAAPEELSASAGFGRQPWCFVLLESSSCSAFDGPRASVVLVSNACGFSGLEISHVEMVVWPIGIWQPWRAVYTMIRLRESVSSDSRLDIRQTFAIGTVEDDNKQKIVDNIITRSSRASCSMLGCSTADHQAPCLKRYLQLGPLVCDYCE